MRGRIVPPRGKIQENDLRYVLRLTSVPDDFQSHAQDLHTRRSEKSTGRRENAKRQKASVGLAWLIGMGDDGGGDLSKRSDGDFHRKIKSLCVIIGDTLLPSPSPEEPAP